MEIIGDSLDDLLHCLYKALLASENQNQGSRGSTIEILGLTLRLSNPLARISRSENRGKPFSAIGELLWYLKKSDKLDYILPYVKKYEEDAQDGVLTGAYGPRMFSMRDSIDQIKNVIVLLQNTPGSKRAVVQLFNAEDLVTRLPEIPCTTTFQFHLRNSTLHMSVNMRSNDAYFGLPHDIFCFTMIQEMMARRLGAETGEYIHHAGSMHVYDQYIDRLKTFISEGFQQIRPMPPMPTGDPFKVIPKILDAEDRCRHGESFEAVHLVSEPYWADLIRMIQAFWLSGQKIKLDRLKAELHHPVYKQLIDARYLSSTKDTFNRPEGPLA